MKNDGIWRVFAETGDPVAYLLYKTAWRAQGRMQADTTDRRGKDPRPAD